MLPQIEPAGFAGVAYLEQALKERPPPAARATAGERCLDDWGGVAGRVRSCLLPSMKEGSFSNRCGRPGPVDAGEKEQPHDIDEMPVPRCCLEAEVSLG